MTALHKIFRRNRLLAWFGLLNFALLLLFLLLSLIDSRELLGINLWIKPMKFAMVYFMFSVGAFWFAYL